MQFRYEDAEILLKQFNKSERMLSHCYASEAIMSDLAHRLGQDEKKWRSAGLLHDIDIEIVGGDMERHGIETLYPDKKLAGIKPGL